MVQHVAEPQRRRHRRYPVSLVVAYDGREHELASWTENLSSEGLFVQTDLPLAIGETVRLRLSFPALLRPLDIIAEVVWRRPAGPDAPSGIGLRAVDEAGRGELAELLRVFESPPLRDELDPFRILIVEDSDLSMRMYQRAVDRLRTARGIRLELTWAQHGVHALELLARDAFELMVTDLYMPVMDGIRLVEKVRTTAATENLPVLMLSCGGEDERHLAAAAGVDAFLEKPVRLSQLFETISNLRRLGRR